MKIKSEILEVIQCMPIEDNQVQDECMTVRDLKEYLRENNVDDDTPIYTTDLDNRICPIEFWTQRIYDCTE